MHGTSSLVALVSSVVREQWGERAVNALRICPAVLKSLTEFKWDGQMMKCLCLSVGVDVHSLVAPICDVTLLCRQPFHLQDAPRVLNHTAQALQLPINTAIQDGTWQLATSRDN